ncbi:MAG: M16 family metallopeptidase [Halothiobacillaceae bacterium]
MSQQDRRKPVLVVRRLVRATVLVAGSLLAGWSAAPTAAQTVLPSTEWTHESGARVIFYATDALPMVDARLVFDAGAVRDTDATSGLAALTATLLSEGAGERDADAFARAMAGLGAEFSASARLASAAVRLRSLSDPERLWPAVDLVADVLQTPRLPEQAFERERSRQLLGIQARQQRPQAVASDALRAALYPGHPYGRSDIGTTETVASLTYEQMRDFHQRYYVAANALLVIVGNLDRAAAQRLADRWLSALPVGEPAEALPPVPQIEGDRSIEVDYPSEQYTVMVGYPGVARDDPDYLPLYLGNHVLGGSGFSSRLMSDLREARGLAYSVYSYLMPLRAGGSLVMGIQTRADAVDEARRLMHAELEAFVETGPTAEELADSQANVTGGLALKLDSNAKIVQQLGSLAYFGLPLDYYDDYVERVMNLTPETVQDAFARRIDPDRRVAVIVGPVSEPGQ